MKLYIIWGYGGYEDPQVFVDPEQALEYMAEIYQGRLLTYVVGEV